MVEPKLTFFEMQIKSGFGQTSKLRKAHFGNTPKVFDAVNVRFFIGEFIISMLHPIVLFITQINETIVTSPSIRMDGAFNIHFTPDRRL